MMINLTDMSNLSTEVNLTAVTTEVTQAGPTLLTILLMVISVWIVVANTLILVCLLLNRQALKQFVNLQILSFSVTDILVGVSAIPVALTYKIAVSIPYFDACAAVLCGYSVAQSATLYHAFVICIHRLITVKRCTGRTETNPKSMYKTILVHVSIPWIESLIVVIIPFLVFGRFGKRIKGCSLNIIFEDDYIHAMTFLTVNMLTPQIGMNVAYVYMLVFLLKQWRRVNIQLEQSRPTATTSAGVWNSSQGVSAVTTNLTVHYGAEEKSLAIEKSTGGLETDQTILPVGLGNSKSGAVFPREMMTPNLIEDTDNSLVDGKTDIDICETKPKSNHLHIVSKSRDDDVRSLVFSSNIVDTDNSEIQKIAWGPKRGKNLKRKGAKLRMSGQKDVLITIGLLLLILNVFMTPLTFLAVVESLNFNLLSRQVKFIIMVMALMNSALNPFVYIFRIKPAREALWNIWSNVRAKICH